MKLKIFFQQKKAFYNARISCLTCLFLSTFLGLSFISCSENEEEIPILEIDYKRDVINFTAQALETEYVTINVRTNQGDWNVECDKQWCYVNKYEDYFVVSAQPCYSSIGNPPATITISSGSTTPISLIVKQEKLYLDCTPDSKWIFPEEGGTQILTINCNSQWNIITNQNWVRIAKKQGVGYDEVEIEVLQSEEAFVSDAKLTISSGDITRSIIIERDYKHKKYQIGDYYPDEENPVGVVFHTYNNGKNGLVVDLKEFTNRYSWEYFSLGATSIKGKENTNLMEDRGISKYPAASFCREKGKEWHLPSRVELSTLFDNASEINNKIISAGGNKIGSGLMSSNEANSSYYVYVKNDGSSLNIDKQTSSSARAVLEF